MPNFETTADLDEGANPEATPAVRKRYTTVESLIVPL
jgi:hypothetical protein